MIIDRRRFCFLGLGVLASGALVPRSPLEDLAAFLELGRPRAIRIGQLDVVLTFRDNLTPALERLARQLKRAGEDLDRALSPIIVPSGVTFSMLQPVSWYVDRACKEFGCLPTAALDAAAAVEGIGPPLEQLDRIIRRRA